MHIIRLKSFRTRNFKHLLHHARFTLDTEFEFPRVNGAMLYFFLVKRVKDIFLNKNGFNDVQTEEVLIQFNEHTGLQSFRIKNTSFPSEIPRHILRFMTVRTEPLLHKTAAASKLPSVL